MLPILSFIGTTGSGKTTIFEKVVAELKRRGLKIAVIKHTHHKIELDKKGKDSQRYLSAGAEISIVSGTDEIAIVKRTDHDLSPREIARLIVTDVDLVLTEGFKGAGTMKIEVHRKDLEPVLLAKPAQLLGVVTDEKLDVEVPQFDFNKDNTVGLADLIENWLAQQPKPGIQLFVNGNFIDMNPFVRDIVSNTLQGMVSSLKGADEIKTLEISLIKKST